ncbi:MAG: LysR family transcriptional regulator [Woeseiaceae bacterium]|nr:LysR family transcriptional regulator [Woeseiaceae bacterium]
MNRMHSARPDLNLLLIFDAVASTGSVTRAAIQLSLSQPAVSHALNRLRDLLGDPLFVRSGNGLTPTKHAESLILPIREILENVGRVFAPPAFDPATSTQTFRIGASDYAMMTVLPDLVRAVRLNAPDTRVEIRGVGEVSLKQLESGEIDLLFWGAAPPTSPFVALELFRERFVGLMCARHPLAIKAGQNALTLDDYLAYPHIMVTFRDPRHSPIDARLAELQRTRNVRIATPNFASNVASVRGTDLIMSLPSRLAASSDNRDLIQFELPLEVPPYPYSIVWHRRSDQDPSMIWLRNRLAR